MLLQRISIYFSVKRRFASESIWRWSHEGSGVCFQGFKPQQTPNTICLHPVQTAETTALHSGTPWFLPGCKMWVYSLVKKILLVITLFLNWKDRLVNPPFFAHTALWWGRPKNSHFICPDQHHWHATLLHPWWWFRFHSSRIHLGCLDGWGNRKQRWNPTGTTL